MNYMAQKTPKTQVSDPSSSHANDLHARKREKHEINAQKRTPHEEPSRVEGTLDLMSSLKTAFPGAIDPAMHNGAGHDDNEGSSVYIEPELLHPICTHLKNIVGLSHCAMLTAIENKDGLELIVILDSHAIANRMELRVRLPNNAAAVKSISDLWPGANWLEREAWEMFGIEFHGHPSLEHLLLAENFNSNPLRDSFIPPDHFTSPDPSTSPDSFSPLESFNSNPLPDTFTSLSSISPNGAKNRAKESAMAIDNQASRKATGTDKRKTQWQDLGPAGRCAGGPWDLQVMTEGDCITDARIEVGYLHTGMEWLAQKKNYTQLTPFTDRISPSSSMLWSHCYVLAVEKLLGAEVPSRAEHLRALASELQRIASHLGWLGSFVRDLGNVTVLMWSLREREFILDLLEALSGARFNNNFIRIGGVLKDMPSSLGEQIFKVTNRLENALDDFEKTLEGSSIFRSRTMDVGYLTGAQAMELGVSGSNLRASGIGMDIRSHAPYSIYEDLDFVCAIEREGDCFARYRVRMEEMRTSIYLIRQILDKLPDGDTWLKAPLRPETGSVYTTVEGARGECGIFLTSDGSEKPARLKVRSPSLSNLFAAPSILRGYRLEDVSAIVDSLDICISEVDR